MLSVLGEKNIPVRGEVNVRFVSGMYYTMVCGLPGCPSGQKGKTIFEMFVRSVV
jgi:hypothetical protein